MEQSAFTGVHKPPGWKHRIRRRFALLILVATLAFTASTFSDNNDAWWEERVNAWWEEPGSPERLRSTLARIDAAGISYFRYSDVERISSVGLGILGRFNVDRTVGDALWIEGDSLSVGGDLSIYAENVDAIIRTGGSAYVDPAKRVILVEGGQDEESFRTAATFAGWSGNDIFDVPETKDGVSYRHARPVGTDVVFGDVKADLSIIDGAGPTLADDPRINQLLDCAGDVVAANFLDDGQYAFLWGMRINPDEPIDRVDVACVVVDSNDVHEIVEDLRQENREYYLGRATSVTFDVVNDNVIQLLLTRPPIRFGIRGFVDHPPFERHGLYSIFPGLQ